MKFIAWFESRSEPTRWTLYLPLLIILTLLAVVVMRLLFWTANRNLWGPVISSISAGAICGYVFNSVSLWLLPRWKKTITVLVGAPLHLLAVAAIVNVVWAAVATGPASTQEPIPPTEALWGVFWLFASAGVFLARANNYKDRH